MGEGQALLVLFASHLFCWLTGRHGMLRLKRAGVRRARVDTFVLHGINHEKCFRGTCHNSSTDSTLVTEITAGHVQFVNRFHCLRLRDLQTLNEGYAGCRPVSRSCRNDEADGPEALKISLSTCSLLWTEEVLPPASGYHVACRATLLQGRLIARTIISPLWE